MSKSTMNARIVLFAFFVALPLCLSLNSCGDTKLNQDENVTQSAMTPEAVLAINMSPTSVAQGKSVYLANCSPCHGASGRGDGPASAALNPKPRDHTNGAYMDKLSNRHIFNVIKNGGASYGYPTMPAQPNLSEDQIKTVVAYIRTLSTTYKP